MMISLQLILVLFLSDPNIPANYYPGMLSAREASKKTGKDLVVFFSEKSCDPCTSAWSAFSSDPLATGTYVSTKVDVTDFDGGIFYDLLELKDVPAWVIFTSDGKEKERWYGGWKDAGGKPTMFAKTTLPEKTSTQPPTTKPSSADASASPSAKPSAELKTSPSTATSGFVVQAGYFGSESNAHKLITDLNSKGFSSFTAKQESKDGATFYRVISKIYPAEHDANAALDKLVVAGMKGSVKKTTEIGL